MRALVSSTPDRSFGENCNRNRHSVGIEGGGLISPVEQHREPQEIRFLPDVCGIRLVFAVVVGAELLAIILTLFSVREIQQLSGELSLRSLYIQWIALTGAGLLCAVRGWLKALALPALPFQL